MEGVLFLYQGYWSGYRQCYALVEPQCSDFHIFNQEAYEDEIISFSISSSENCKSCYDLGSMTLEPGSYK